MSIYQKRVEDGSIGEDIHYAKPVLNEKYLIIPKEDAQKLLKGWRDITTITNERRFPFAVKVNQSIYARMYGGYGTASGGVVPGTEAYFNQPVPPDANSLMGNKVTMTPKQYVQIKEKQKKEKERNPEFDDFDEELNKLKEEGKISEESGKPEISKILKEKIIDGEDSELANVAIGSPLDGVSALTNGETPATVENVTGGGDNVTGGGGDNTAPITAEKPKEGTKVPPIIIQHSECGHLTFGDEKKDSNRARDVGLYAGDSNALRLFRDGGFELRSSESQGKNQKSGSSIMQVCDNAPLTMNSEGDIFIRAKNKLVLRADHIEIESTHGSTEGVVIKAKHDINIRADNNIIMTSDNITLDAKERVLTHSEGWTVLIGQYIRLHEPQTKICPAFLEEYIDGQIKTLKG